jgi:hypothetical protein
MKRLLSLASTLFFVACASSPPAAQNSPPRYANPDEIERLQKEARANFERLRQDQGTLAPVASGPALLAAVSREPAASRSMPTSRPAQRKSFSQAEARYALTIGKSPSDLTAGERAVARSE